MTARRKFLSTSTHDLTVSGDPVNELAEAVRALEATVRTARKHGFRLLSHNFYSRKAQDQLTTLRRRFLAVRSAYSRDKYPSLDVQLSGIERLLRTVELNINNSAMDLAATLQEIGRKVGADLAVEVATVDSRDSAAAAPFLPIDIVRPGVYQKILDEANASFANGCFNACSAMLRRLIESLIIEAFEAHSIEARIKGHDGEYQELKALIGKACGEPTIRLSRNSRSALPNLKMLGDLSLHSRGHLVRAGDLERIRNDTRVAVEELASHLQS
jgi:hypothetical protein